MSAAVAQVADFVVGTAISATSNPGPMQRKQLAGASKSARQAMFQINFARARSGTWSPSAMLTHRAPFWPPGARLYRKGARWRGPAPRRVEWPCGPKRRTPFYRRIGIDDSLGVALGRVFREKQTPCGVAPRRSYRNMLGVIIFLARPVPGMQVHARRSRLSRSTGSVCGRAVRGCPPRAKYIVLPEVLTGAAYRHVSWQRCSCATRMVKAHVGGLR